jgi:hypothetical protein
VSRGSRSGCSVSSQIALTWLMRDDREDFNFKRSDGHGLGVSRAMVSAADKYQGCITDPWWRPDPIRSALPENQPVPRKSRANLKEV